MGTVDAVGVLLAAGAGRRYGFPKVLAHGGAWLQIAVSGHRKGCAPTAPGQRTLRHLRKDVVALAAELGTNNCGCRAVLDVPGVLDVCELFPPGSEMCSVPCDLQANPPAAHS